MLLSEKYHVSIEGCKRLLEQQPSDHATRGFLAYCLFRLGKDDLALEHIENILSEDPHYIDALYLKGAVKMMQGNFDEGWPLMEYRQQRSYAENYGLREYTTPRWDGSSTTKKLLVWAAEGFGDTIQNLRYLHLVTKLVPNVILEVQPNLKRLCQSSFPLIEVVDYNKDNIPDHDLNICVLSLPSVFKTIPGMYPYLRANLDIEVPTLLKVGICWHANKICMDDFRSCPDDIMMQFGDKHDFLCLHKEAGFRDFAETASAMDKLDLVISVDTSVAHLAGALGKDVWLILNNPPDHRWMREIEYSPWYPTMRIFRQDDLDDWPSVMNKIETALYKWKEQREIPLTSTKNGLKYYNTDMIIGKSLSYYGEWSPGEGRLFDQFINMNDVVLDVGANIGAHSVHFAKLVAPEGLVLAFEPQKTLCDVLNENLESYPYAKGYPVALSDKAGFATVVDIDYTRFANFGGVKMNMTEDGYQAKQVTIDLLFLNRCDFIKIDVEGMEWDVLRGAIQTIRRLKPTLYFEYNEENEEFLDWVEKLGYYLYMHEPPLCEPKEGQLNLFPGGVSKNVLALKTKNMKRIEFLSPINIKRNQKAMTWSYQV